MDIFVLGINHKKCPVEIREKIVFSDKESAYNQLSTHPDLCEKLILTTCNRSEIYIVTNDFDSAQARTTHFFNEFHNYNHDELQQYFYTYQNKSAISHLFAVISGLDSMVLGEPQITGQVKEAYKVAHQFNSIGTILHKLLQIGLAVNKEIRATTEIGSGSLSVSYSACQLAKKILHPISKRSILLLGAGKMAKLAAVQFKAENPKRFVISNRSKEKTNEFVKEFNCEVMDFADLSNNLYQFDIILVGTGAQNYLISKDMAENAMKLRMNEPIFIIDISVPRNVDPEVSKVLNLFLYDIDDLNNIIHTNKKKREEELIKANLVVENKTEQFLNWLTSLDINEIINKLNSKFESIRKDEVDRCFSKIKGDQNINIESLNFVTEGYMKKLLHPIITTLKDEKDEMARVKLMESISRLFDLKREKN